MNEDENFFTEEDEEDTSPEEEKFFENVEKFRKTVSTREELSEYADFLADGYREGFFEEQPVSEYVGGLAGVLHGLDGYYKNNSLKMPKNPTWNMMAGIITRAFYHS